METQFFGVRGTIPAPGPDTVRYGGNTPCVAVRSPSGSLFILDMGTGIVGLGQALLHSEFGRGAGRATILLSHEHWDHIQGFPFFAPVFVAGNRFSIHGPSASSATLEGILEGQMDPKFSPINSLRNLGATVEILAVTAGETFAVDDVVVSAHENPHGGTVSLAYRLESGGKSVVYAPDAGYLQSGPSPGVVALYRQADLLIHDCTYTPEDQAARLGRGHSSIAEAVRAAVAAEVGHLVLFHYDQDYGDDQVDRLRDRCRLFLDQQGGRDIALSAAAEGLVLRI